VIAHFDGEKADLVVCDGAPDGKCPHSIAHADVQLLQTCLAAPQKEEKKEQHASCMSHHTLPILSCCIHICSNCTVVLNAVQAHLAIKLIGACLNLQGSLLCWHASSLGMV